MKTITKIGLKQSIDQKQDMLLIDVLPQESFNKKHIQNAINIPVKNNENFVKDVEVKAKSKNQLIVVYCASTRCDASKKAAEQLEKAGFTNVQCYEEGLEGWFDTGEAAA